MDQKKLSSTIVIPQSGNFLSTQNNNPQFSDTVDATMISQSSVTASQQSIDFSDLPIPSIPSSYRRQKNATSTETLALKDTFSNKKQCLDADCNSCPQHSMSEANILRKEYISMLESNNDNEEAKIELENIESSISRSMKTNRDLLQSVTVNSKMERKFEFQQMLDVAQELAKTCLRNQPCVPADWEDAKKISTPSDRKHQLPAVCCAFENCFWSCTNSECSKGKEETIHPWDSVVYKHILSKHKISILEISRRIAPSMNIDSQLYWDIYKQGIAVKEREGFPFVGVSVDRRSFDYTLEVYNDKNIKCLMCFGCIHWEWSI